MHRFNRAVLIGTTLVLCIDLVQLIIIRVAGWSPMWTLFANAATYGLTGFLAAEPPALRRSALAGCIVGALDGLATLGALYLGGILRNQPPWMTLIPLMLAFAGLAGAAIGTLGGVVSRRTGRGPVQAGA